MPRNVMLRRRVKKRKREDDGLGSEPRKAGKVEEKVVTLKAHQQQMERLQMLQQACRT